LSFRALGVVHAQEARAGEIADAPHRFTRRVERFARQLEGRFHIPVTRVDERFTSVEAESRLRGSKNKAVDSVAAQLILEQYFDQAA